MKIGAYTLPILGIKKVSLLWNNEKDRDYEEAIKEIRQVSNNIQQIVIKTEANKASYSTTKIVEWFLNQHWDRGIRYTTNEKGHMIAIRSNTKYRVFIPNLWLIIDDAMYRLTPQCHIYPSDNDEHLTEDIVFPVYNLNGRIDYLEGRSEYAFYKHVRDLLERPKPVEVKPKKEVNDFEPALFRAICNAYEIDPEDEKAFEQTEYYIMNKLPIVRIPQDEVIYGLFVEWGIAPASAQLNDLTYTDVYDDSNITYIGKETYLETYEEQENDYYYN